LHAEPISADEGINASTPSRTKDTHKKFVPPVEIRIPTPVVETKKRGSKTVVIKWIIVLNDISIVLFHDINTRRQYCQAATTRNYPQQEKEYFD